MEDNLFDAYARSSKAKDHPGTGLGLSITRQILLSVGGDIQVGKAQEGAEIIISLPKG